MHFSTTFFGKLGKLPVTAEKGTTVSFSQSANCFPIGPEYSSGTKVPLAKLINK
uniref:Uncharacterized protein n=1 Tax=Lepeophtheirus salmonis TaxID=72036 RepID=A0A0K2TE58_LEPSM